QNPQTGTLTVEPSSESTSTPATPVFILLKLDSIGRRHKEQLIDLTPNLAPIVTPEFPKAPLGEKILINEHYRCYAIDFSVDGIDQLTTTLTTVDDKPLIEKYVYLFNVIVALEWLPSLTTIQQLMNAFRSASDFLYDCTNGSMAIGQVIFSYRD